MHELRSQIPSCEANETSTQNLVDENYAKEHNGSTVTDSKSITEKTKRLHLTQTDGQEWNEQRVREKQTVNWLTQKTNWYVHVGH